MNTVLDLFPQTRHGHTTDDYAALVAAGVDPDTTQPREHDVRCHGFGCTERTWNQSGGCSRYHYREPAAVNRVAS